MKYEKTVEVSSNAPLFSKRLAEVMNEQRLSQIELVALCNNKIGKGSLCDWLSGKTEPKIYSVKEIAKALNVSVDYLLGLSDVKTPDIKRQAISRELGLSDKAIETFKRLNNKRGSRSHSELLSCLLESDNLEYLLGLLEGYITDDGELLNTSLSMSRFECSKKEMALFAANNCLKLILDEIQPIFLSKYVATDDKLDKILEEKVKEMNKEKGGH